MKEWLKFGFGLSFSPGFNGNNILDSLISGYALTPKAFGNSSLGLLQPQGKVERD